MSDRMTGMSFDQLMNWVTEELENHGTLFGLHRAYKAPEEALTIFGRDLGPRSRPQYAACGKYNCGLLRRRAVL